MDVLLIADVDNLGYAGDVKKVANGYGRNYLIPQKMAVLATPGTLKQAETIRKSAEKRRAQERQDAEAIANQIADLVLLFERRAGETGKLYGSVTSHDIAAAIKTQSGITIDKRKVALPEPIRSLGEQKVTLKLMIDVSTTIKVEVLPIGGILERSRLAEAAKALAEAEAAKAAEAEAAKALAEAEAAKAAEAEAAKALAEAEAAKAAEAEAAKAAEVEAAQALAETEVAQAAEAETDQAAEAETDKASPAEDNGLKLSNEPDR